MFRRLVKLPKKRSFFLFGARGVGKTTLLRSLYEKNCLYINLLKATEEEELFRNPDSLKDRVLALDKKKWVIIDEIQKVPKLLDIIHDLIEEGQDRFILTGSSSRKLKRGSANLLAGRAGVRTLHPLTHIELAKNFKLNTALEFGTLPKIYNLNSRSEKIDYLKSYIHTYVKEEILIEQVVRNLDPFRNFLEVAAQMNGKIVNYSKISRDVGASVKTVQNYYQILADTNIGFFLNAFHESWRKQISQAPKFYFFDTGVARALSRKLSLNMTEQSYEYGDLFEQFIICELNRLNDYYETDFKFSYLRTKDDTEIDLIIDRPGRPRALIEIKSSAAIRAENIKTLRNFKKEQSSVEAFCLSRDPHEKLIDKVRVIPWQNGIQKIFEPR